MLVPSITDVYYNRSAKERNCRRDQTISWRFSSSIPTPAVTQPCSLRWWHSVLASYKTILSVLSRSQICLILYFTFVIQIL